MRKMDRVEADQPKSRLRDTENGQTIIVSFWLIGTIATLLVWAGAFLHGSNLANPQEPSGVEVLEPTIEVSLPLLGPPSLEPGTWVWSELRGGECLQNFADPFAENFVVVSCDLPHNAEVIFATLISQNISDPYPGISSVVAQARQQCDLAEKVDIEKVAQFRDLRIAYSYPVSSTQWERGERGVYCFGYSESGEPFVDEVFQRK